MVAPAAALGRHLRDASSSCAQGPTGVSSSTRAQAAGYLLRSVLSPGRAEIIEGEVVEIQIDRPATGTVKCAPKSEYPKGWGWVGCAGSALRSESHGKLRCSLEVIHMPAREGRLG